jgi:hypothetical protein
MHHNLQLGSTGINLPNTKAWYASLNFKKRTVTVHEDVMHTSTREYNVSNVVISALAATLEVYFWTQCKKMSDINLITYRYLIDNARRHTFHLKALCTNILNIKLSPAKTIDRTVGMRISVDLRYVCMICSFFIIIQMIAMLGLHCLYPAVNISVD